MSSRPPKQSSSSPGPAQPSTTSSKVTGFREQNRQFLGLLNLVAAILLIYFAIANFLSGLVFIPFGFGLMGLYFFYSYVRTNLKVDLGKFSLPFNLFLLLGALGCLLIGLLNQI